MYLFIYLFSHLFIYLVPLDLPGCSIIVQLLMPYFNQPLSQHVRPTVGAICVCDGISALVGMAAVIDELRLQVWSRARLLLKYFLILPRPRFELFSCSSVWPPSELCECAWVFHHCAIIDATFGPALEPTCWAYNWGNWFLEGSSWQTPRKHVLLKHLAR